MQCAKRYLVDAVFLLGPFSPQHLFDSGRLATVIFPDANRSNSISALAFAKEAHRWVVVGVLLVPRLLGRSRACVMRSLAIEALSTRRAGGWVEMITVAILALGHGVISPNPPSTRTNTSALAHGTLPHPWLPASIALTVARRSPGPHDVAEALSSSSSVEVQAMIRKFCVHLLLSQFL